MSRQKTIAASAPLIWKSLCPTEAKSVPEAFSGKAASIIARLTAHITAAEAKEKKILAGLQKKGPGLATLGDASGVSPAIFRTLAEIRGLALCIGAVKAKPGLAPLPAVRARISKVGLLTRTPAKKGAAPVIVPGRPIGLPLVYDSIDLGELAETPVVARPMPLEAESHSEIAADGAAEAS